MFEAMTGDPVAVLQRLVACDLAACDSAALGEAVAAAGRVQAWLEVFRVRAVRRAEQLRAVGEGAGAEAVLQRSGRMTRREARGASARAVVLGETPVFESALADGVVTAAHADALARAVGSLEGEARAELVGMDAQLATAAAGSTPEEFASQCKRLVFLLGDGGVGDFERQRRATTLKRWVDCYSGMYQMTASFDPETGARLWSAIDAQVAAMFPGGDPPDTAPAGPQRHDHLAAIALAAIASGGHAAAASAGRAKPPRPEMTVVVDLDTLVAGLHQASVIELAHGGTVPVATLRRWACDADLLPAVLSGDGVVLDVGRSQRLATADQRRALRAMYPTCAFPGCGVLFDHCKIHHFIDWTASLGPTNLANLAPLCERDHHLAHEGGWRLVLDPVTRVLTAYLPDGTVHASRAPPRRRAA